ncbi:WD40/YVTN/BNR-like repeat-containing protein [Paractinoplanes lichenicola]|uniref:Exo-alpha-sialidase n=1 Tax=Paractinoplanes lichenicola TaxID=2802976 RepID=A0ABS1VKH5_9ACTN|nr:sialidase family protein [Actinoplanes lichenicola]MBL7255221.1 exo-alpha-sialidase [Actinoplanes lichenicola]
MTVLLAIGTQKGLFLASSDDDRRTWRVGPAHFPGTAVYTVGVDTRGARPRLLAAVDNSHFGPSVAVSDDLGATWHEPETAPIAFPADAGVAVERVWQIVPGHPDEPGVVYAGSQPSALFRSTDGGESFELVRGLWDHPHRPQWGAGFGGQAIHTILPHPGDPSRLLVAMSTGGVYRSADGGASWAPANKGIKAYFFPDPWPEFGQCVHRVARDAGDPERLYAQNHHGVYRSADGGDSWQSIADTLPSDFGFPMVAHPRRPGTIWNFPLTADGERHPTDLLCRVYRSTDAGEKWEPQQRGLPPGPYYPVVLRDAMCTDEHDPVGVYFGTRCGEVFATNDEGESWATVVSHLPDVLSVRAVTA